MQDNKLYKFLKLQLQNKQLQTTSYLDPDQFQHKTSQDKKNYILYNLPFAFVNTLESTDYSFNLTSHHVSFYQTQDHNNPFLSCYHYTAYFKDQNESKYQLHLYFDQNEQLVNPPVFSVLSSKGKYKKVVISSELKEEMIQFAFNHSSQFISDMRKQYNQFLRLYITEYETTEQELTKLSAALPLNLESYNITLKKTIAALNKVAHCHPNTHYSVLLQLFNRIQTTLKQIDALPSPQSESKEDTDVTNEIEIPVHPLHAENITLKNTLSLKKKIRIATDLYTQCKEIRNLPAPKNVELFLAFESAITNLLFLSKAELALLELDDLKNIQAMTSDLPKFGTKLLTELLIGGNFKSAESLKKYAEELTHLVALAIKQGNAKLLDFILSNSHYPINTSLLDQSMTPIALCFNEHSDETPKTDCFSVLLKHHASVMINIHDYLPLADCILSAEDHPFKKPLLKHAYETIGHRLFYKQVINCLKNTLAREDLDKDEREEFLASIHNYQNLLEGVYSVCDKQTLQKQDEARLEIKNQIGRDQFSKATQDKDVAFLIKKCNDTAKELAKSLPPTEQRKINRAGTDVLQKMAEASHHWDTVDFATLKKGIMKELNKFNEILSIRLEMISISKEASKKANTRKVNKLNTKYLKLEQRALELMKQNPFLSDYYESKSTSTSSISIDRINNLLQTVFDQLDSKNVAVPAGVIQSLKEAMRTSRMGMFANQNLDTDSKKSTQKPNVSQRRQP